MTPVEIGTRALLFMHPPLEDDLPRFPRWLCNACSEPLGPSGRVIWPNSQEPHEGVPFLAGCSDKCIDAIEAAYPPDVEWQVLELGRWLASLVMGTGTTHVVRTIMDGVVESEYVERAHRLNGMPRSRKKGQA